MSDIAVKVTDDDSVYQTLLESTKAIPWKIDWDSMRFSYIGPQIESLLGWPQSSWVSAEDWAFRMHPDDREHVVNYCVSQSQAGTDHEADYRALTRDGGYVWIRDVVHVVRKDDGEVESLVGFMFDISERKRAEAFAEQTSEILKKIATGKPASIIYDAIALMYEERHPGLRCSMLELKGNKLIHGGAPSLPKEYCDAVNGLEYGPAVGSCGTSAFTGKRVLVEAIAADPKWEELKHVALPHGLRCCWSEPIKNPDGEVLGAFGMYYNHPALPDEYELADLESAALLAGIIMQREQREARLRKLSLAIEQAGESVIITDAEGTIEYVNPSFTRMTGYSAEEVLGKNPRILMSGHQADEYYKDLWSTITDGRDFSGSIVDRRKDGTLFPAIISIAPILNDEGSISHYVGLQQDMTEQELLEDQLRQSQKMEAIGTLVGGIAHDFNNMLAGMTGNLYLAKLLSKENPNVLEKLTNVEGLSFRAADMIQQLLTFARKDRVSMKLLPFSSFIHETIKRLQSSIPENIAINQNVCADALIINGDATQIHQILLNLINNACDALEWSTDPSITIRLEAVQVNEAFIEKHIGFATGVYAHLSVEDNGCGIPENKTGHLFEPFFTTKEVGKGTGLGLAMVFGAVKSHNGFVEVESVEGEGSIFHIYLPLVDAENIAAVSKQDSEVTEKGKGETILLVDDQKDIVDTGKEVLESMGYRVITAANGQQAVDAFKGHPGTVDLIVMDVVMPVMSGDKAAQLIRQIDSNVKIIFSTGYDKDSQVEMENEFVISKPFSIAKMSELIRQTIDTK